MLWTACQAGKQCVYMPCLHMCTSTRLHVSDSSECKHGTAVYVHSTSAVTVCHTFKHAETISNLDGLGHLRTATLLPQQGLGCSTASNTICATVAIAWQTVCHCLANAAWHNSSMAEATPLKSKLWGPGGQTSSRSNTSASTMVPCPAHLKNNCTTFQVRCVRRKHNEV